MTYEFFCPHCNRTHETVCPADQCTLVEQCECGQQSYRRWSVPHVVVSTSTGLTHSKADLKHIRDTTGRTLEPVGNEDIRVKPKQADYSLPREIEAQLDG